MKLPDAVAQTCDELIPLLRAPAADWVRGIRDAVPPLPTVAVIGETQRGKSALVNALLATPDLSPVRDGVSTAARLVFVAAAQLCATAHHPEGATPVDPRTLADLALLGPHRVPRWIEIGAPVPLLERLTVIDGEPVEPPTALLVVTAAAAPLARPELEAFERLARSVETVLFALTGIDVHAGWRAVLDANRAALAGTRFAAAPWFPVSPALFEQARTAGDAAPALRRRSGIAELQIAVQQQVTGRASMLGAANTLRALRTALDADLEQARRGARTGDPDRIEHLQRRRADLETLADDREWRLRLRAALARARVDCAHDVAARCRAAQSSLRAAVDTSPPDRLHTLPQQVDVALQALAGRVGDALTERISGVLDDALAELFDEAERAELRAELVRDGPVVTPRPPQRRAAGAEDAVLVVLGFSGGMGVGRIAALPLVGFGAGLVLPISLALGLSAGWWMARARRTSADRAHLRQWLVEVFAEARSVLDHAVSEQLIDAEHQLALALDRALRSRQAAVDAELAEVRAVLDRAVADRDRTARAAAERIAVLDVGRERVNALLTRIAELRDTT